MRVRSVDQNSATPIDPLQGISDTWPMGCKNNDVAFGCLLLCPGGGAWTKIGDNISQCLRTPGIGYNNGMTSGHQMASKRTRYGTGTYKSYFHD
jgi:hypothetical protein